MIDENGNVTVAKSASNHLLLQQIVEQTTQHLKFNSTLLDAQKVTGLIGYSFIA